jgi:dolichol kinase
LLADRTVGHPEPVSGSSPAEPPQIAYEGEVWRKLLHLFALAIPVGYYFVSEQVGVFIVLGCFLFSLLVDIARFRHWRIQRFWRRWTDPIVRPKEEQNFTGATNILASGWLCPLLFTRPAAALGMCTIILGDTAAALIGRRWGHHRFLNGRSLEGSVAFFIAAGIGGTLIPGIPLSLGLSAALLATVVEAISSKIDDNLTVPLIAGLFAHLALRIL